MTPVNSKERPQWCIFLASPLARDKNASMLLLKLLYKSKSTRRHFNSKGKLVIERFVAICSSI